jgi:hypothetical protein
MSESLLKISKRTGITVGLVAGGLLAGAVLFFFDPTRSVIYPVCLFHKFTGLNCPGCGSLRALHRLTHGEFAAAFTCNPLLIVVLLLMASALILRLAGQHGSLARASVLTRPATVWAICAIVIIFGVLRNIPGRAFAWMSP